MTIVAAADGSALGNPGPTGWAWYVDDSVWQAGGWPRGTNNQGELMAVLALLRATAQSDDDLVVYCDSKYVINSVTKWMPSWKRRGWRKADGKPVLNRELLSQLDDELADRRVTFEWVRGHTGHELNEAADERARAAATAHQNGTDVPAGPGWRTVAATQRTVAATQRTGDDASRRSTAGHDHEPLFDLEEHPSANDDIARLTHEFHSPEARRDPARFDALLHAECTLIPADGTALSRAQIIADAARRRDSPTPLVGVEVDFLGADAALVAYRESSRIHTALWLRTSASGWQLRHDQATETR